jgi:hypothetical protein
VEVQALGLAELGAHRAHRVDDLDAQPVGSATALWDVASSPPAPGSLITVTSLPVHRER